MPLLAVTVVVVLASGDPGRPTPAMERALRVALGDDAQIVIEDAPAPSDDAVLARARDAHASGVGVVTWSDHERRATIHFARPAEGRFADREIRFDAGDAPDERGRTVGFAIASMLPEEALAEPPRPPPPEPPPAVAPPSTSAPAAVDAPRSAERDAATPVHALLDGPSVEAAAVAAAAPSGYGGGIGGGLAVRLPLGDALRLRAGASGRVADIEPASATSRVLTGDLGLAWQHPLDRERRVLAGARVAFVVQRHELVHFSADDAAPVRRARWLPGGAAAIELAYRFAGQAALTAAAGAELVAGRSAVFVHDREVATVAPLRTTAELGVRVYF